VKESGSLIETVGRWPWKLASAKKRVTTYLPNQTLEKMEGKEFAYETFLTMSSKRAASTCWRTLRERVWRDDVCRSW